MKFHLRQAVADDIESIVALSIEHLKDKQVRVDELTVRMTFQVLLEHPAYQIIVAEHADDGLVGLVTASTSSLTDGEQHLVFLENLFVLESARSQGVAHQLMQHVMMETTVDRPIYGTSVATSDLADTGPLFIDAGYQQADEDTSARIIASLSALPLERGLEGDLTYYTLTPQ